MKRSVEFDLLTKIEANARFASKQGMFAKSRRIALQRAAVKAVLAAHFGAMVPPRYVQQGPALVANRIEVKLTRISPGRTADAWENLRGALKGPKDQVAAWIGIDDREGAGITWLDPGQEQQGPAVYRIRIEITDQSPGPDRVVVLTETASEARKAKARVKRMVAKATGDGVKKSGRVLSYQPAQVAAGASSAARSKAEERFAQLQGIKARTVEALEARQPTALDLRDAAERVLTGRSRNSGPISQPAPKTATSPKNCNHRDPGEERPARDLAPCTTCGAAVGEPCKLLARPSTVERLVYGVHVARAIAAGLPVPDDDRASLKAKRTATGPRKPAVQVPLPAYARLPWNTGRLRAPLTRWEAGDKLTGGPARIMVPAEHVARFGSTVTLRRHERESATLGKHVVYE